MKTKQSTILTIALTVLLALFLLLQGVPYFNDGGGGTSLAGYLAFPADHTETTAYLEGQIEGYNINSIVAGPIAMQVAAIVLLILLWRFRENVVVMGAGGIWGLAGMLLFSGNNTLRLGGGTRVGIVLTCTAALAISVAYLIPRIMVLVRSRKAGASEEAREYAKPAIH